jgi:nucleotide-binding universal stress UspA family protein
VRHIVVGTDGSAGGAAAIRFCQDIAPALGVPVTAVLAAEPFLEWVPESDPQSWHRRSRGHVLTWMEPVAAAGVPVDVVVDRDIHPVAALSRALAAHEGSIAVVGTRGLGGFTGLRLGRVPVQLVHHAGTAVILVPSPTQS